MSSHLKPLNISNLKNLKQMKGYLITLLIVVVGVILADKVKGVIKSKATA